MDAFERDVLLGRSPAWRELWEERLSSEDRRRITQAVHRGQELDETFEAALAAGLAHQRRRALQAQLGFIPLWLGIAGLWIYAYCLGGERHTPFCEAWVVIAVLAVLVPVVAAITRLPRLRAAEERNRRHYIRAVESTNQ